ncbi:MAG: hypothetical protein AAGF50_07900 [Pseudomonadota bacterium]
MADNDRKIEREFEFNGLRYRYYTDGGGDIRSKVRLPESTRGMVAQLPVRKNSTVRVPLEPLDD